MPLTIAQILQQAKNELVLVSDQPAFEADLLLAFTLCVPRTYLLARPETIIDEARLSQFQDYLTRRKNKEPLAYILGTREFWSMALQVNRSTLIPRPETELLVETLFSLFSKNSSIDVAELGTGSGAISIAIASECPSWRMYATDINPEALAIAAQNAAYFKLHNITFYHGDWCEALPSEQKFNVIVSNPPYLSQVDWERYGADLGFEPKAALVAGESGLEAIDVIIQSTYSRLKPGGYLLLEHGYTQGKAVRELFAQAGFKKAQTLKDLAQCDRVTLAIR